MANNNASCQVVDISALGCIDGVPGISEVWLANFDNVNSSGYTTVAGIVTAITMNTNSPAYHFFRYRFPKNSSYAKTDVKPTIEVGSTSFEQSIFMRFPKEEAAKTIAIQLIGSATTIAVVKTISGKYFLYGKSLGLNQSAGVMQTGTKAGDLEGYEVTLLGTEPALPLEVSSAIIISPIFPTT